MTLMAITPFHYDNRFEMLQACVSIITYNAHEDAGHYQPFFIAGMITISLIQMS